MTKLIAIRVQDSTYEKLYSLAAREHRNPGQQLDAIIAALDVEPAPERQEGSSAALLPPEAGR